MKKMMRQATALVLALVMVLSMIPGVSAAALKQGSRGTEVKRLQQNLIGLGYLEGEADGSFGSGTRKAVERFQSAFGLTADGSAGTATKAAIRNAVIRLQVELNKLGFDCGSADGSFGSKTRNALLSFQKQNGLCRCGVANKETWAAINAQSGGMRADVSVRKGSYGTNVTNLQRALIGLGFLSGSADGRYGRMTEEAVRKFQKAYGLQVDGSAGKKTMTALKNAVVTLQSDLARKGYASGTINGVYGNGTKSAVAAYQKAMGITANGVAGPKTLQKLWGYSMGGTDAVSQEETYKIWIDPLYQDGDYSKIIYGYANSYSTTVKKSGCGGVALAMALNARKDTDRFTGQNVMQWFADHDYYWGQGTKHEGIYKYAKTLGLNAAYCGKADKLVEHLKKGRVAVALIKDKTGDAFFTYSGGGGHYILVSGYRVQDGEEQVFVNNPLSYKCSCWFDLDDLMDNVIIRSGLENPFIVIYK